MNKSFMLDPKILDSAASNSYLLVLQSCRLLGPSALCNLVKDLYLLRLCHLLHFRRRLLLTTLRLLSVMAPPAIIGLSKKPLNGYNRPAAMGMPITL